MQGWGWLAMEELWWNDKGELKTHAPSTYKIPTAHDVPGALPRRLLRPSRIARTRSTARKAVGEPPFMLALSAFHALRDAVASVARPRGCAPRLDAPATDERILAAIEDLALRARATCLTRAGIAALAARVGARRARRAGDASRNATGSTPREAGTAMVVAPRERLGTHRRRASRVRGDPLARDALAQRAPRRRPGSCASRSRRGSASAAAASRRSRSPRSTRGARLARRAVACARTDAAWRS